MAKIFYNINESDYIFETENFTFYFSSEFYKQGFIQKVIKNRETLKHKLTSRYNIEFDSNDYFDFILYSKIEKRGFRIIDNKNLEVFQCLNKVKLNGEIKISENYKE